MNNIIMVSYAARMSSWQEMKLNTGKKKTLKTVYANSLKTVCKSERVICIMVFLVQQILVKYIDYYKIILICIQVSVYFFGKSIEQASILKSKASTDIAFN